MSQQKVELEQSDSPPVCPHCKASLKKVHWHKVHGGPSMVGYIALLSCPQCRAMLGVLGS